MNLVILIVIPLLTLLITAIARTPVQVRFISLSGSVVQLFAAMYLFISYRNERSAGNGDQFLFSQDTSLFPSLGIHFHIGVDGISVAMILLTALVVLAGVLVSWKVEKMTKEFYLLLLLLSIGAYGFFIAIDLFVLFFLLS